MPHPPQFAVGLVLDEVRGRRCVLLGVLLYRLLMCALLRTSFVPDEYHQGVEPAYRLVYGGGGSGSVGETWEWQEAYRIRSYVLLLPHLCLFALARFASFDAPWVIRHGPRIVQSLVTVAGDWSLFLLVDRLAVAKDSKSFFSPNTKYIVLVTHLFSWSASYCGGRTLANTTEASLACVLLLALEVAAQPHAPLHQGRHRHRLVVALSTLLVMMRPTALLLSAPAFACLVWRIRSSLARPSIFGAFVADVLLAAVPTALACLVFDSACYGAWTCTPCNFVKTNVWDNMSAAFGRQPWHWNFSQGLPTVLGLYSPVVLWALCEEAVFATSAPSDLASAASVRLIAGLSLLYPVLLHCASSHQEIRFLLPSLPGLHVLVGSAVERWLRLRPSLLRAGACVVVCATHVLAACYLLSQHQAGPEAAMRLLSSRTSWQHSVHPLTVHILAPCYSFPGRSFLHIPLRRAMAVSLHALECSPAIKSEDAALLQSSPAAFVRRMHAPLRWGRADVLITFDSIAAKEGVEQELARLGLVLRGSLPHAALRYDYDEPDVYRNVLLYSLSPL